ncbi:hypothetical protein N7519_003080 [Penicillium mononematosum]|uniref:uncharacterized protein n=1 Tax=Penicillium mononematosum TaxID=268346 RepID=UPI0025481ED3|nr:uncharacterized protein N7519_003080 [Penicillium mononematosum]KAJ6188172.1 hypothetical protein N7519_003080 [Penicillium mononematosum]
MSLKDLLPSTTRRYKYVGIKQCIMIMCEEIYRYDREERGGSPKPHFIIECVDERSFLECFVNSEEKVLTLSWETYDHVSQFVILEVGSLIHENAKDRFDMIFFSWAKSFRDTASAEDAFIVPTNRRHVRGETMSNKGDISWMPIGRERANVEWPTLVGEVAWSEPRQKLLKDIEFWLKNSNGQVKVAITITVHVNGRITIEQWTTKLRPDGSMNLQTTQKMEIVRNPAPNCPRISGQFKLQFCDIFLREKKGAKTDFVLTESDLEDIAGVVWANQFLGNSAYRRSGTFSHGEYGVTEG